MTSSTTTSRSLTRGRKSSAPIGGREGPTGYDVSPIAIYVSKGRLCARLPYCPHRGWVSYESQPSRGNMARYRGIPYQDGSRGLPGRISPQVIPFRYSGYRPCFLDHFQISGDPTRSGGTGPRSLAVEPISPIDELSNIALGFGMLNASHRRHTRRPAISPKMESPPGPEPSIVWRGRPWPRSNKSLIAVS